MPSLLFNTMLAGTAVAYTRYLYQKQNTFTNTLAPYKRLFPPSTPPTANSVLPAIGTLASRYLRYATLANYPGLTVV